MLGCVALADLGQGAVVADAQGCDLGLQVPDGFEACQDVVEGVGADWPWPVLAALSHAWPALRFALLAFLRQSCSANL